MHPKKSIYEQLAVVVKDQLERRASEDGQLRRERVGPEWTNYAAGSGGDGGDRGHGGGGGRQERPGLMAAVGEAPVTTAGEGEAAPLIDAGV